MANDAIQIPDVSPVYGPTIVRRERRRNMGCCLHVYLVPKDLILRFPGCGDVKLLRECLGALREQLAEWDEDCRDEDNEDEITHEQAFRELFSGVFTADYDGAPYGSAFEALCRCLGRMLPNASFAPCRLEWFEQLDGYLESERVPLRLSDLIFRPPIEIPRPGEQPLIGHWTHADIVEAVGPLANVAATASDPDVAEALTMVADWCRVLTKSPGRMIVGFFA